MSVSQASRTLVKSAPELWAEISDPAALARHLAEFGEITITRSEPERTVAWEGERASGTVELEVSGWGTKVHLTAQLAGDEPVAAGAPAPALAAPEPVYPLPQPVVAEPEAEPALGPDLAAPPLSVDSRPAPATSLPRRGFLARVFPRRAAAQSESAAPEVAETPPKHDPQPSPAAEPPPAEAKAPPTSSLQPTPVAIGPIRVLEPATAATDPAAHLESVLDVLGTAHRRPFSRG